MSMSGMYRESFTFEPSLDHLYVQMIETPYSFDVDHNIEDVFQHANAASQVKLTNAHIKNGRLFAFDAIFIAVNSNTIVGVAIFDMKADRLICFCAGTHQLAGWIGGNIIFKWEPKGICPLSAKSSNTAGATCIKCNKFNEYAAPNLPNGTFKCFACRSGF